MSKYINFNPDGRILAIDLGTKNIGLAISDFENKFCLNMWQISNNFKSLHLLFLGIREEVARFNLKYIVIGYPENVLASSNQSKMQKLAKLFYSEFSIWNEDSSPNIVFEDERFTTKVSLNLLKGTKNAKLHKDAMAAKLILELHLEKISKLSK